jgi:hypothetical protein
MWGWNQEGKRREKNRLGRIRTEEEEQSLRHALFTVAASLAGLMVRDSFGKLVKDHIDCK